MGKFLNYKDLVEHRPRLMGVFLCPEYDLDLAKNVIIPSLDQIKYQEDPPITFEVTSIRKAKSLY